MEHPTDIQIAQQAELLPIAAVAEQAGIEQRYLEQYGRYKAKIDPAILNDTPGRGGRLVLVTAMTPTPAGEG